MIPLTAKLDALESGLSAQQAPSHEDRQKFSPSPMNEDREGRRRKRNLRKIYTSWSPFPRQPCDRHTRLALLSFTVCLAFYVFTSWRTRRVKTPDSAPTDHTLPLVLDIEAEVEPILTPAPAREPLASPDELVSYIVPTDPCEINVKHLSGKYGLTKSFDYSRTFVTSAPQPRAPDPSNMFGHFDPNPRALSKSLLQGWESLSTLDSESSTRRIRVCSLDQVTQVPIFAPLPETTTQGRNILVGYATTAARVRSRLSNLQHGFAHTGTRLIIQLPSAERSDQSDTALVRQLQGLGVDATIIYDDRDYRVRWASMPKTLRQHADADTWWFMVLDDDALIVSLPRILTMLDKYDHTGYRFIGSLTDKWQNTKFGAMSFGGSGSFLSLPLVNHLMPHWDDCAGIEEYGGGDQRLTYCVYTNSWTRMSWEQTVLNQNDAEGDIRGLFESGQRFGTLHHVSWRVRQHDESLMTRAAATCKNSRTECLFQRFISECAAQSCNSDVASQLVWTNGWAIVRYPTAHLPDFGRTEYTWDHEAFDFWSHSMGPLRPRIPELGTEESPKADEGSWRQTWLLTDVYTTHLDNAEQAATSHVFIKRAMGTSDGRDSVIELIWI